MLVMVFLLHLEDEAIMGANNVGIDSGLFPKYTMEGINDFAELSAFKGFKLAHLNVRSLLKKVDQLRMYMINTKIDVLTISETWLKPHLNTALVNIEGYTALRLDRKNGRKKRGGGLLTYVHNQHDSLSEPLPDLDLSNENLEVQWTMIQRPHFKNIILGNVYRPPAGSLQKALDHLDDCLKTINISKTNVFLLGDWNINYQTKQSAAYKKLLFFIQSNGLTEHINSTTRVTNKSKSLIDLILTNSKFVMAAGTLEHFISDNQPVYLVHKKSRDTRPKVKFLGSSYRNFDRKEFRNKLLGVDWRGFKDIEDPCEAWEYVLDNINTILDSMCPLRTFHIKNYGPDWMTKELIELLKDRDYFYKKAKLANDDDYWNIAKYLRNLANISVRQAKRDQVLRELRESENDVKKFWRVIREIIPSDKAVGKQDIILRDGGKEIEREQVAHFINDYFINIGNVGRLQTGNNNTPHGEETLSASCNVDQCNLVDLREAEVLKVINNINVSKSSGLDNINSTVIKEAFKTLIREVTYMFNLSVRTAKFPDVWKKALVIPIPKTGNLTNVKNYRPISLLPLPGKILEKLVHQQLSYHLESQSLLAPEQHGFRRQHSTIHSVVQLTNFVSKKLDSRTPTLVAYIDFRKAFDCVQHAILISKLKALHLSQDTIAWITNYLRQQRVLANGVCSSAQTISQGVPQGSVLGPILYIIYANELPKNCQKM